MSAPMAAEVLRELGAQTMVFVSLKHAVRWFNGYGGSGSDLGSPSGGPRSRESIEIENATYASLLLCFRWLDPACDEENLRNLLGPTLEYVCGDCSIAYLADDAGLTEQGFQKWVARGERVLRGRLLFRGLMRPKEWCDCGCGTRQVA